MTPRQSLEDRPDRVLAHAVLCRESPQRHRRGMGSPTCTILCPDLQHLCRRQGTVTVSFPVGLLLVSPLGPSTFSYGVSNVLALGTREEVQGMDAAWGVAVVTGYRSHRQRPVLPLENEAGCPTGPTVPPEPTVPILIQSPTPQPAALGFMDMQIEPFQCRHVDDSTLFAPRQTVTESAH